MIVISYFITRRYTDTLCILTFAVIHTGKDLVNWGPQANIGMGPIHFHTFT